eukprot:1395247-Rhodomonas_salina.1
MSGTDAAYDTARRQPSYRRQGSDGGRLHSFPKSTASTHNLHTVCTHNMALSVVCVCVSVSASVFCTA